MGRVAGIDLGTTNSCLAIIQGDKPIIIPNAEGERVTPSVVARTLEGQFVVGSAAKRQAVLNPTGSIFSSKRLIGRAFKEVQSEAARLPYPISEGEDGLVRFTLAEKSVTAPEIGALIIQKLVRDAQIHLGEEITDVVVTVPAYFSDLERQETKRAAEMTGLNVLRIINEPTAAAMAYGLGRSGRETILVFDLGGGTLDVTVLDTDGVLFEVLSTSGDTHLGGDDFDQVIMRWVLAKGEALGATMLREDPAAIQRIREAAEAIKIELSSVQQGEIRLPFLLPEAFSDRHVAGTLNRSEFEELCAPLFARCREPIHAALEGAQLTAEKISRVLLVGGSGRIPAIKGLLQAEFPTKEIAAPPNAEEIVALGAAVQAGILSGEISNRLLIDVTPFSLGIEVDTDKMVTLIHQNSPVPVRCSEMFTTAAHFQRGADIRVVQLDASRRKATPRQIGKFSLEGLKTPVKGEARIKVTFEIDESGILTVTATDLDTKRESQIVIRTNAAEDKAKEAERSSAVLEDHAASQVLLELIAQAKYLTEKLQALEQGENSAERSLKRCRNVRMKLQGAIEKESERDIRSSVSAAEELIENLARNV